MKKSALPKPNVTYLLHNTDTIDEKGIKGMLCNPIYTGLPPFQQVISDEAWVQAATQLIEEEGPEQFLVNMLYVLRESMNNHPQPEAKPTIISHEPANLVPTPSPIALYCYHDDFPMIDIHGSYVCVAEYIFEHLDNMSITDLILEPEPALVFQNGHTLPLLSPLSGQALPIDDEDLFLDTFSTLGIVDLEWDDDQQALVLYFGPPIIHEVDRPFGLDDELDNDEGEAIPLEAIAIHLNSIRKMTCPYLSNMNFVADD